MCPPTTAWPTVRRANFRMPLYEAETSADVDIASTPSRFRKIGMTCFVTPLASFKEIVFAEEAERFPSF